MAVSLIITDRSGTFMTGALQSLLETVAQTTFDKQQIKADAEVGLTIVDDEEIARLNDEYRGIDEPTDVLSFPMLDEVEIERLKTAPDSFYERPLLLGDVVISAKAAARQAEEYGHDLRRELAYLFVHGLLHLLGYDHDEPAARSKMRLAEEAVLETVGLSR